MQFLFIISAMIEHHSLVNAWQWAYFKSPTPFLHHRRNNCVGERSVVLDHVHVSWMKKSSLNADKRINRQQNKDDGDINSYQTSASVIKGIVSSLTSLTNAIFQTTPTTTDESSSNINSIISSYAPASPQELLTRISNDYTINNYLWTGKLDTSCFISDCTFTDPTLSFVGVHKYITNVHNLIPIVNYLLRNNDNDNDDEQQQQQSSSSRSDLLSITINETDQYIETRWNMVGNFTKLFWKPRIDVIGKTKFWYQQILPPIQSRVVGDDTATTSSTEEEELVYYYQVYLYDEQWEIPAGLALLQLVTRAGTIPNTNKQ
jgi:hypothetical protein